MRTFDAVSPYQELLAYETLWARAGSTMKKVSDAIKDKILPSYAQFNLEDQLKKQEIIQFFNNINKDFSVLTSKSYQYPKELLDPEHQIKLLYYKGDLGLIEAPKRVSIVGARKATDDGKRRAAKLARMLSKRGYVIVSGLAEGIDTAAMKATIEIGGKVIGAIGTPINEYYPPNNKSLQDEVAKNHLLISHVPIYRYANESFKTKKYYFPQRNVTMASLSDATIIVEASDTSGTLTQARACMSMGRKLFILDSCFRDELKWPYTYEKRGAFRVKNISDILDNI